MDSGNQQNCGESYESRHLVVFSSKKLTVQHDAPCVILLGGLTAHFLQRTHFPAAINGGPRGTCHFTCDRIPSGIAINMVPARGFSNETNYRPEIVYDRLNSEVCFDGTADRRDYEARPYFARQGSRIVDDMARLMFYSWPTDKRTSGVRDLRSIAPGRW